jgi:hypothetical protein
MQIEVAPSPEITRPEITLRLCRGVRRALTDWGWSSVTEFWLANGRRADVFAIDPAGRVAIVEVKSGLEDFRTDAKWPEYREWCDEFYFAVEPDFPHALIPDEVGLIIADGFAAEIVRASPETKLAPARRKSLLLGFAIHAAGRLHRLEDPMLRG